jgi:transposase
VGGVGAAPEALYARSRDEGAALVNASRETAAGLVARARARSNALNEQLRGHAQALLAETTERLAEIETDRASLHEFARELEITLASGEDEFDYVAPAADQNEEN